jgi:GGDEF domain-containing protein
MAEMAGHGLDYLKDPSRLAALKELNILGSAPEEVFDSITRLASRLFGAELASIHLLDDEKQWAKSSSDGVCGPDTPLGQSFCEHTVSQGDFFLVTDPTRDPRVANSPFVTGSPSLQFYAGMPLTTRDGHHIGALCLLDGRANVRTGFSDHEMALFRELANITVEAMHLRAAHDTAQHNFLRATDEDAVTGLMSHHGLLHQITRSVGEKSHKRAVAVIGIRLHDADVIKSAYGDQIFNQVLREVAERLYSIADSRELLARVDDETFLVARLFSCDSDHCVRTRIDPWAESRAQAALHALAVPFLTEDEDFFLDVSAGVSRSLNGGVDAPSVLERAKDAAKSAVLTESVGKAIQWEQDGLSSIHRRRLSLKKRLRNAISNKQMTVAYQPIVSLQNDGAVVGAEALVRWPQSEGPPIGPDLFIPIAEDLGLIQELGLWVFEQACEALRYWQDRADRNLWISVNFSPL